MYKFTIREPYWQFGGISVDISKCSDEEFEVECTHKTADGKRYFPGVYKVKRHIVERMRPVKPKPTLRLIPFDYLRSLNETN
jgi:hypothetical protein